MNMKAKNMIELACFPFDPDKFAQQTEAMEEHLENNVAASGAAPQNVPKEDTKPGRNTDNSPVPRAAQSGESTSLNENDER